MAETELPTLALHGVAAIVASSSPLLVNRDPAPDEVDVPLTSTIILELFDPGVAGVSRVATRVWVNGALAFDGNAAPEIASLFGGPRASVTETADALRLTLDAVAPFASEAVTVVRVVSQTKDAAGSVDETYSFRGEDHTAPRLVAAVATSPRSLRLGFDEPVFVAGGATVSITARSAPAVPVAVVEARAAGTVVDLTLSTEATPDAVYRVKAIGISDAHGNACTAPFDEVDIVAFRPARPAARRFDLWSMLPKHNRRADVTGDLARFVACLQEITDLLLAEADRFPDVFDLERAPEPFLDLILRDLGDPFPFELDTIGKRRLAAVLVEMYRQKGTAVGVKNAVRFFLGVDIDAITPLAAAALVLGESELDHDWELGPSDRFARYAFDLKVARVLSPKERRQLRAIVEYLKPAHTHFVNLVEPLPPPSFDDWELGESLVGVSTDLH